MSSALGFRSSLCRHWPAAAVLLAGLALTAGAGWELQRQALIIDQKRLDLRIKEVIDQLDGRVEKTEQLLQQLQDFLSFSHGDKEELFREWNRRRSVSYNYPWVCGILVATNVQPLAWHGRIPTPAARDSTNWPAFQEFCVNLELECRVALQAEPRANMTYLDDYDLRGSRRSTNRFGGFVRAAGSAGLRLSRQQTVMFDRKGRPVSGVLFLMPIHNAGVAQVLQHVRPGHDARARAVRWAHLDAMIAAPVDFQALERAVWNGKESDLGVEIFSRLNQTSTNWLNPARDGSPPKALDSDFKAGAYLTATAKWPMFVDRFSIFFYTTPLFEAQSSRRLARTVTWAGVGLTLLATALMAVITRARLRQEQMTATLLEARDALAATEKERERLGHDLHDGAIQSLYAVQLGLTRTVETVESEVPAAAQVLQDTRKCINEVIAELRRFILSEKQTRETDAPPGLEQVLASMVGWLAPTTPARLRFETTPGISARVNPGQSIALIQIARTALGNALRHAQATRIDVTLRLEAEAVKLVVEDDGVGFMVAESTSGGLGLHTMRTRVDAVGGTLAIASQPGGGTRVTVIVPAPMRPGASPSPLAQDAEGSSNSENSRRNPT